MKKVTKRLLGAGLGCSMALAAMLAAPAAAVQAADQPNEIMLGVFFGSDEDTTDTLYWSLDGVNFYELAEAYEDATPDVPNDNKIDVPVSYAVETLHDPSIAYKDGIFWMLAGFATNIDELGGQRRFVPMFGYSKDLIHWSYPNSGSSTNIGVMETPPGAEKYGTNWDSVAPDVFVDDDGSVWITTCMGYYANFHGDDSANDIMKPYLIKVDGLGLRPEADSVNNPAAPPVASYSDAVPINLPVYNGEVNNRIDGSLYKEGDTYYFIVKKDGVTNEIWKTKSLTLESVQEESNWELVCDDAVTGFEGPCLTKFNGTYFLYTDKLKEYPPEDHDGKAGVRVNVASIGTTGQLDEWTGWLEKNQYTIQAHNLEGGLDECRHGTVITLTDPDAINVVWNLKAATRYADTEGTEETPEFATGGWYQKESFNAARYGGVDVCYWYEDNQRQGVDLDNLDDRTAYRGKEIYDPDTDGWYWMDNIDKGKMAVSKDVYQPNTVGDDGIPKWVRYDQFGKMLKGQVNSQDENGDYTLFYWFDEISGAMKKGMTQIDTVESELVPLIDRNGKVMKDSEGNTAMTTSWYRVDADGKRVESSEEAGKKWVYYDDVTGIMLYGYHTMDGKLYYFDEYDGTAINGWGYQQNGDNDCWYECGERQGYRMDAEGNIDLSYRGKEIYDPFTDAWYWCDNVQKGAIAKGKSVYQESYAGIFGDREDGTGKWVTYDDWGKMIKGWDWGLKDNEDRNHYHELITGAMAKGEVWITSDGEVSREAVEGAEHWFFDLVTGDGTRLD